MDKINNIFRLYDNLTAGLPQNNRLAIAIGLFLLIIWLLWIVFKKGRWIFLVILVILLPALWPILKEVGHYLVIIFTFLITRIRANI